MVPLYESLELTITKAVGIPSFTKVGNFEVVDEDLAKFKIDRALTALVGNRVFGSGYPIWPRDMPDIMVREQYAIIYDESQVPHSYDR